MELSLVEIWESMGFLAKAVAIALVGMGVGSLAVSLERLLAMRKATALSASFSGKARPLLESQELSRIADIARGKEFTSVPLASLLREGVETFFVHAKNVSNQESVEMTRRALDRKLEVLSAEARRGMGLVASTGSTAPFIGLFGTVIGIITAFQGIAAAGGGGIGAVSAGIAEALIVTAVGLFVAIASVLFFNFLNARFDLFDRNMTHAAGEFIDFLENFDGNESEEG